LSVREKSVQTLNEEIERVWGSIDIYVSRGQASSASQVKAAERGDGKEGSEGRTTKRVANRNHSDGQERQAVRKKGKKRKEEKKKEELRADVKVSDGGWSGNALSLQQGRTVGIAYHIV